MYVIHGNSTQKHHLTHVIVIIIGKTGALISMIDSGVRLVNVSKQAKDVRFGFALLDGGE